MTEFVITQAVTSELREILIFLEEHGENQIVDNPTGVTKHMVDEGNFFVGRRYSNGELVAVGGWQVKDLPLSKTGRLGTSIRLQIHRDVVVHRNYRGKQLGPVLTAHNQLLAQLYSGGSIFASVAAMLGDGLASDIVRRLEMGETIPVNCFAANVTPGLVPFMIDCISFAVDHAIGRDVHFAFLNHRNLPMIARKGILMMTDGYPLGTGYMTFSEPLRALSRSERKDLFGIALGDLVTMQKYGLAPASPAQQMTMYGRFSDLVA